MYKVASFWPLLLLSATFFFNEFLIFYLKIGTTCRWPEGTSPTEEEQDSLHVFMIADTHILGKYRGHWLDKIKREWQMQRAYRSAIALLSPEVIFFLGDLMDEGKWSNEEMFAGYSNEFKALFSTHVPVYVVAGNHDVGFHYEFHPQGVGWFKGNFNRSLVDSVTVRGHPFVFLNSMAFHGDGCYLCRQAEVELETIAAQLDCSRKGNCTGESLFSPYRKPILLLHFPLYRKDESVCIRDGEFDDAAPKRDEIYRPKWESLSEEATLKLIRTLQPRAVFNGHAHRDCRRLWNRPSPFWEYTVNSFSWRNGDRPTLLLVKITPSEVSVRTCFLPNESTTFIIYAFSAIILLLWVILRISHLCAYAFGRRRSPSNPLLPDTKEDKSD